MLDTTELKADRFLETNDFRLLLRQAERGELSVWVPEVTLMEAINHVRESGRKALADVDRGSNALRRLRQRVPGFITDLTEEQISSSYTNFLRGEFERHHIQILPTPPVPHRALVERALDRRKPFDGEGRKGYRDALIWETVRERADASGDPVAFITNNHTDFAENGEGSPLAETLAAELADPNKFTLWPSLKAFIEAHVRPVTDVVDLLNERLQTERGFVEVVERTVFEAAGENDADTSVIDLRSLVDDWASADYVGEEVVLAGIETISDLSAANARVLSEPEVLIDLSASADADIDFRLWRMARPSLLHLLDFDDQQPRTITGTKRSPVRLRIEAIYRRDTREIEAVRIASVRSVWDPEQERLQEFRAGRRLEPAMRAWEQVARSAAIDWAKAQGYDAVSEDRLGLDVRDARQRAMVFGFVADPSLVTALSAAVQRLGLLRSMIDPQTRAVVVVPHPLDSRLATRIVTALEPPVELYMLSDGQLVRQG